MLHVGGTEIDYVTGGGIVHEKEIKITFINAPRMREINSIQGYEDICRITNVFDAASVV